MVEMKDIAVTTGLAIGLAATGMMAVVMGILATRGDVTIGERNPAIAVGEFIATLLGVGAVGYVLWEKIK